MRLKLKRGVKHNTKISNDTRWRNLSATDIASIVSGNFGGK